MTPFEFAERHFGQYRVHGNEIIPTYCPYCHGGQNRDKHTFALNAEKLTFNCKRGSCGVSGTFNQLCRDFGEEVISRNFELRRPKKEYKTPTTKVKPATAKVEAYLKLRGFSKSTWERRGVGDDGKGNIAFPYYENGKLVLMKFRPARKVKKGERKGWREKGGKPVFWGMDLCTPDKPLIICEGEGDALALDECGIPNVVSVPSGAEDLTCVDECWDWLEKFKRIIIWVDNDEPGQRLQRNLIKKLGAWRCSVVSAERKDANEVLVLDGKDAVIQAVNNAVEVPVSGLVRLADVRAFDYASTVRVRSGIRGLDSVTGGFMMGQVSVWTGINSSGKSTLLGQIMLEAIDQGFAVCAYSGELPAPVFRYWIDLQAAGPRNIEMRFDSIRGAEVAYPKAEVLPKIREWYRDKFFLHDSFGSTTENNLLEVFEYAARRYDCRVFLIDNLMTTVIGSNDKDFYRKQSEFVGRVMDFAHKHEVHVHLVAHPRKTTGRLTKMDVAGSGDITNRPDNVFGVHRLTPEEQQKEGCEAMVDIFKNRFSGRQDVSVGLKFIDTCKRFYMASDTGVRDFSWNTPTIEEVEKLFEEEE